MVAAKTADPHPKLPGTIYTAAEESEFSTKSNSIKIAIVQSHHLNLIDNVTLCVW